MQTFALNLDRRQSALMLRLMMMEAPAEHLAKITKTAAKDLRRIAHNELAPTAGVLAYLSLRRSGRKFIWEISPEGECNHA